jgi:hypothetical protein
MYSLLDLLTQLVSTSNYSAIDDLDNSQITAAPAKHFPACCVFISRFLATASKSGDSSASRTQVLLSQPPVQILLNCELNYSAISSQPPLQSSTELVALILFFITPRRGPHRQHPVSPVAYVTVAAGTCLLSRCPGTGLI